MERKLYIRCDASQNRGFGHLRRCLTMAAAFKKQNVNPIFLQPQDDHQAISLIKQYGFKAHKLPAMKSYLDEAPHYPTDSKNLFLDLIHVDTIADTLSHAAYLKDLKDRGFIVAVLDGLFEEALPAQGMPEIDCVMKPYVGGEEDVHPPCKSWIAGAEYAILDEKYQHLPRRSIAPVAKNILITFGGADPQGITAQVMAALRHAPDNVFIRVTVGPYFSQEHIASIDKIAGEASGRFQVIKNQKDLIPHYLWADIAIGGSGTSRYEFAATGLPAIFTSIYTFHEKLSRVFADNGLGVYLGYYETLKPEDWQNAIISLIKNDKRRLSLSESGYKKIDTCGADRLVTHLNKSIFSY